MKVYLLVAYFCWGYEDHGTETIAAFKDLYHAELAAYWLKEEVAHYDRPHLDYYVEELPVL